MWLKAIQATLGARLIRFRYSVPEMMKPEPQLGKILAGFLGSP
jgi:hypothetical protein